MGSANFPNRPFRLRDVTTVTQQDQTGNRSLIHFEVWIDKTGYSPTLSNNGPAYSRWGFDSSILQEANPGRFDFTGGGPWRVLMGDVWVPHNADGTRRLSIEVGAEYDILGATSYSYWFDLPTIPRFPPPAPTGVSLDQITRDSMRYTFASNGDGGSPILGWDVQYSADPSFSGAPTVPSLGQTTVSGLRPGTVYYFRSRGYNTIGYSTWSNVLSARTKSGAWISDGTNWQPAEVWISDGTSWSPAEVWISDGASWQPAG